jgi:hypothetical protein
MPAFPAGTSLSASRFLRFRLFDAGAMVILKKKKKKKILNIQSYNFDQSRMKVDLCPAPLQSAKA